MVKRVKVGGCWFRTLDVDAGIRAYMGPRGAKRFWHGYYSGKAVDHYTGGAIPIVESASRQEYDLFDDHYDSSASCSARRRRPPSPTRACPSHGVQETHHQRHRPVFPWRPSGGDFKRHDHDTHDRHGIPRCKHCGEQTNFVRFSPGDLSKPAERRNPRLWFDCMVGATPACTRTLSISCKTDWRLLVPLWRTDSLYHELKESHGTYEAAHDWWRDRYKVAADDLGLRPKVRSIGFHRLRANAASLVEWLRICYLQGWLGSPKRNHREAKRGFQDRGELIQTKLANMRVRMGVAAPYGTKAEQLQLGQRTPPSRRPRGAPPGQTTLDLPV